MTGPFADRLFRIAFAAAGIYNLAFGLWAAAWPLAFFELFELSPPRYPGIWACLGMVVGVYGLLYLHAAWKLEAAWPIVAVGLLGKVLGPVGMAMTLGDEWPRRVAMLCAYNDLIWWLPFGLFLVRGTSLARWLVARAAWLCVISHLASVAMLATVLRRGGPTETDVATRGRFVADHATAWTLGWGAWMLAAASLIGFYARWGGDVAGGPEEVEHTGNKSSRFATAIAAVVIAYVGMVFDYGGESLSALVLVERAANVAENAAAFVSAERAFTLLSAGAANGLYTIGGVLLTLLTSKVPAWIRVAMWLTWVAGAAMSVAAAMNHVGGIVASAIVLFPMLVVWVSWMGVQWNSE